MARRADRAAGARAERRLGLSLPARRCFPPGTRGRGANFPHLERLAKLALWSRGGFRFHFDGPPRWPTRLAAHYRDTPTGRFDSEMVGQRIYGRPLEVVATARAAARALPAPRRWAATCDGCRIGFDLGGSDRKAAAVIDGRVVWSEEMEWDPYPAGRSAVPPPRHRGVAARAAAAPAPGRRDRRLRRGRVRQRPGQGGLAVPGRPARALRARREEPVPGAAAPLARPALRGGQRRRGDRAGRLDVPGHERRAGASRSAPAPPPATSRPRGTSPPGSTSWPSCRSTTTRRRRATSGRATAAAGCSTCRSRRWAGCWPRPASRWTPSMPLPERLKLVQTLMEAGDPRAAPHLPDRGRLPRLRGGALGGFYPFRHVLVLGRVTSGPGGTIMRDTAAEVLRVDFPAPAPHRSPSTPPTRPASATARPSPPPACPPWSLAAGA